MAPQNFLVADGRKYVWDGAVYREEAEAARVAEEYRSARFDVKVVAQGGEWLLFTRREAAEDAARG